MDKVYLSENSRKFKGNLHTHSNRSDGRHKPAQVVSWYKQRGYDFICLSDHEIYYDDDSLNTDDFICLSGYEMRVENKVDDVSFHLHGLLDPNIKSNKAFRHDEIHEIPDYYGDLDVVQRLMDEMKERGNLVIFNHPNWSRNSYESLEKLTGFSAIEIYNHQSEIEEACGYSVDYWDYCLRKGMKCFGVATDDAHSIDITAKVGEAFGGYIVCDLDSLSQEQIIKSIGKGTFYASQAPQIFDLRIEKNILKIKTSEVRYIKFIVFETRGSTVFSKNGESITYGEYKICGDEQYIRVEAIDRNGYIAWSNPIFIKEGDYER